MISINAPAAKSFVRSLGIEEIARRDGDCAQVEVLKYLSDYSNGDMIVASDIQREASQFILFSQVYFDGKVRAFDSPASRVGEVSEGNDL